MEIQHVQLHMPFLSVFFLNRVVTCTSLFLGEWTLLCDEK